MVAQGTRKLVVLWAISVVFAMMWLFCVYIIVEAVIGHPSRAIVRAIAGSLLFPYGLFALWRDNTGASNRARQRQNR